MMKKTTRIAIYAFLQIMIFSGMTGAAFASPDAAVEQPGAVIEQHVDMNEQPAEQDPPVIDYDELISEITENSAFNGNVLIAQSGNILFENSYGYSDFKKRKPLTKDSVFQLASVSKQFTAMAVMMLHDEGKLSFDDPVAKYIKGFPYKTVTIRHLLTHRAGLPDYLRFSRKYRSRKAGYLTNKELIKIICKYKPKLLFQPGSYFEYSNTGYAVLSSVIEEVSGKPYRTFMQERIFTPLGMKKTYVYDPNKNRNPGNPTRGYTARRRPVYIGYLDGVTGDKGIYSTVEDLYLWDQALYTETLIAQKTLEEAFEPYGVDSRNNTEYGFGWRIKTLEDGEKVVFHAGFWGGYKTLFVRRLSDQTAVIVLSNRANWNYCNIETMMQKMGTSHLSRNEKPASDAENVNSVIIKSN